MQLPIALAAAVIALQDVTIVDTINGKTLPSRTVVVRDGRISAITSSNPPKDAQVIKGTGKFLIPGLWDMHMHLRGGEASVAANEKLLNLYLANGVTGVREMGGDIPETVFKWRAEINAGQKLGPRIFSSGPKLDGAKPSWPGSISVTNPEQGKEAVHKLSAMDADLVKIYFPYLDLPTLSAITTEAHKRKLKVAGHKPANLTVREFVEAGVDEIQHARWYLLPGASLVETEIAREYEQRRGTDKPLGSNEMYRRLLADYSPAQADAMIQMFVKNDTWITPTLAVSTALEQVGINNYSDDPRRKYIPELIWKSWDPNSGRRKPPNEETRELIGKLNARTAGLIPLLRDAGVPILAGSDSGHSNNFVFPGWSLHEELSLLRDAGLTNAEALQTATINAARYFKETKRHGSIGKGKAADLVLLDADPLVDIRNTRKIAGVMRQGRWFDRKALDQMLNDAATAK